MAKTPKTKEERIELRVRPQDKRLLEKAAQTEGLSLSSYVVSKSIHAAHEEAAAYRTPPPAKKEFQMFLKLLHKSKAQSGVSEEVRRKFEGKGFNERTLAQALRWIRLANVCSNLNPRTEQALAEEGFADELKNWPKY